MGQIHSDTRKYDYDKKIVEGKTLQMYFNNKDFKKAITNTEEKKILLIAKKFGGESGDKGYNIKSRRRDLDVMFPDKVKAKKFKTLIKQNYPNIKFYADKKPAKILILGKMHKMPKLSEMQ